MGKIEALDMIPGAPSTGEGRQVIMSGARKGLLGLNLFEVWAQRRMGQVLEGIMNGQKDYEWIDRMNGVDLGIGGVKIHGHRIGQSVDKIRYDAL